MSGSTPAYRRFGNYSGFLVVGEASVTTSDFPGIASNHLQRAAYLTACLEAPHWGTVQSYDGAGMSAGLLHAIAYYHSTGRQGSLWGLLRAIELACHNGVVAEVWGMLAELGWYVATDGVVRSTEDGGVIRGMDIRAALSAPLGKVPLDGERYESAKRWAMAFSRMMADPITFGVQINFCIDWLNRGHADMEGRIYRWLVHGREGDDPRLIEVDGPRPPLLSGESRGTAPTLSLEQDLAMCVYQAFSVNAPSPAARCLSNTQAVGRDGFPRALVHALGTAQRSGWEHRYRLARARALSSGLWPSELFAGHGAVMPATLG